MEIDSLIALNALGSFKIHSKDDDMALLTHEPTDPSKCPLSWQYGGDIAANMVLAASTCVPSGSQLRPMSLHVEYVKPGSMAKVRNYHVERLRQSERFLHVLVSLKQDGQFVATANVTFHTNEHSPRSLLLSPEFPEDCLLPNKLVEDRELLEQFELQGDTFDLTEARYMVRLSRGLGFETRPVIPIDYFRLNKDPVTRVAFWLRFRRTEIEKVFPELEPNIGWSAALLAYASDYRARSAGLRQAPWFVTGRTAAMSHAMNFAPDPSLQMKSPREWFLYDTRLVMSGNNTVLCHGNLWNEDRQLLATVTQQGLARPKLP